MEEDPSTYSKQPSAEDWARDKQEALKWQKIKIAAAVAGSKGTIGLKDAMVLAAQHEDDKTLIMNLYKDAATYAEMGIPVDIEGKPEPLTKLQRRLFPVQRTSFAKHIQTTLNTNAALQKDQE